MIFELSNQYLIPITIDILQEDKTENIQQKKTNGVKRKKTPLFIGNIPFIVGDNGVFLNQQFCLLICFDFSFILNLLINYHFPIITPR